MERFSPSTCHAFFLGRTLVFLPLCNLWPIYLMGGPVVVGLRRSRMKRPSVYHQSFGELSLHHDWQARSFLRIVLRTTT